MVSLDLSRDYCEEYRIIFAQALTIDFQILNCTALSVVGVFTIQPPPSILVKFNM